MSLFTPSAALRPSEPHAKERRRQVTPAQVDQLSTADGVPVRVELQVSWRTREIPDAQLGLADLRKVVACAAHQRLLRCIRSSSFATLLMQRDETARQLRDNLGSQLAVWGVRVTQITITTLAPDSELEAQREASLLGDMRLRLAQHDRHPPRWQSPGSSTACTHKAAHES